MPNDTNNQKNVEEGNRLLVKIGLCWAAFVAFCSVLYGVSAGLASYSLPTSPAVHAGTGSAIVQAVIAGFFSTLFGLFFGTIATIVFGVIGCVFVAVFFGGNGKTNSNKPDSGGDANGGK